MRFFSKMENYKHHQKKVLYNTHFMILVLRAFSNYFFSVSIPYCNVSQIGITTYYSSS